MRGEGGGASRRPADRRSGPPRIPVVAGLLFLSGACALAYQTVWFRQFRLIFGGSTDATAAVLAVFMGGLGVGSAVLGGRADLKPRPLRFYATLELLIAVAVLLSPLLLWAASIAYIGLGGSRTMGVRGRHARPALPRGDRHRAAGVPHGRHAAGRRRRRRDG